LILDKKYSSYFQLYEVEEKDFFVKGKARRFLPLEMRPRDIVKAFESFHRS